MSKAKSDTFISAVTSKTASAADIEVWIEKWHLDDVEARDLPEYLGFTPAEYENWLENPNALHEILAKYSS